MSSKQDPTAYFNELQQIANQQDRAKLMTLAVEFGSTLERLPKLRAEMDAFLALDQTLDYIGLVQRVEPQLVAAADFLDEVDFLPNDMRQKKQVKAFIRRAETSVVLRTVMGTKQRLEALCIQVREQQVQEEAEVARKAQEAAERKAAAEEAERKAQAERDAAARNNVWSGETGQDQYGRYGDLVLQQVKQRFRFIPAGSFIMGSPKSEPERDDDETQHRVTLQQGFWLADAACTQDLWQAVMGDNPRLSKRNDNNHKYSYNLIAYEYLSV